MRRSKKQWGKVCYAIIMISLAIPVYADTSKKLTIGAVTGDYASILWIADAKGYFREEGLEVTLIPYEAGLTALEDNLTGKIDVASVKEFPTTLASYDHPEIRILACIGSPNIHELVARKDRGIAQVADLKGKHVGFMKKSSAHFFLINFLEANGLSFNDIKPVCLTPSASVDAMDKGEIDAAMLWDPYVTLTKKRLKGNAISWSGQGDRDFYFLLTVREELLKTRPEIVKPLVKAILKAERLIKTNEPEAKDIISHRLKRDRAYMDQVWPKLKLGVSLPQSLLIAMEDGARLAIRFGITKMTEIPNFLELIDEDDLRALDPEKVSLIR